MLIRIENIDYNYNTGTLVKNSFQCLWNSKSGFVITKVFNSFNFV